MTVAFDRPTMIGRLATESFDVVVVGGGITGAGVALDAAARGLRVALVERLDYASGTSSKSSKLVHGGLRYLQQGEIGLVYEALHERRRLLRNAPHLVQILPFLIPVMSKEGVVSRKIARAFGTALWMYDLTGGWRIGKFHKRLSPDEAVAHLPTTRREHLASAYLYYDATVDDARLCLTVVRTAAEHGAVAVNRAEVVGLTRTDGRLAGVTVEVDGRTVEISTRSVVNAAGVWGDRIRMLADPGTEAMIRPAKGVHMSLPWDKVRNDIAVVIPVPGDKRSLFVVPHDPLPDGTFRHTYVGTTDTDYDGPLDNPQCTADDIAYMLRALNAAITTEVTEDDVVGTWAGLRPLVAAAKQPNSRTSDLSRRHKVLHDRGVISITGGKLTTYREMAEDTVDEVLKFLRPDDRFATWRHRSVTKKLRLLGGDGLEPRPLDARLVHLQGRYGTLVPEIEALIRRDPGLAEPLVPGLAYVRAEAVYAVRAEQATTLDDVLSRRTRARLFDRHAAAAAAGQVARLLAPELGWDDDETAREVADFLERCAAEDQAAELTSAVSG